jgi:hypothetical protein
MMFLEVKNKKPRLDQAGFFRLVPVVGLEPTRVEARRILNPLRLPISPHWLRGAHSNNQNTLVNGFFRLPHRDDATTSVIGSEIVACLSAFSQTCSAKGSLSNSASATSWAFMAGEISFQ